MVVPVGSSSLLGFSSTTDKVFIILRFFGSVSGVSMAKHDVQIIKIAVNTINFFIRIFTIITS